MKKSDLNQLVAEATTEAVKKHWAKGIPVPTLRDNKVVWILNDIEVDPPEWSKHE